MLREYKNRSFMWYQFYRLGIFAYRWTNQVLQAWNNCLYIYQSVSTWAEGYPFPVLLVVWRCHVGGLGGLLWPDPPIGRKCCGLYLAWVCGLESKVCWIVEHTQRVHKCFITPSCADYDKQWLLWWWPFQGNTILKVKRFRNITLIGE